MAQNNRIIFALDVPNIESARKWVLKLKDHVGWFKIGLELFTAVGPDVVKLVKGAGISCFLDLKFHDIPNTVDGAVRSAVKTGADMMTIHLSGGRAMISAALKAAQEEAEILGIKKPKIVGVSVLTSLGQEDLNEMGIQNTPAEQVVTLAQIAAACKIDCIVCSADDLSYIRPNVPDTLMLITPGIRPVWSVKGDQKRIATPSLAIKAGADLLVIGRPISDAPDPIEAVNKITEEMKSAST